MIESACGKSDPECMGMQQIKPASVCQPFVSCIQCANHVGLHMCVANVQFVSSCIHDINGRAGLGRPPTPTPTPQLYYLLLISKHCLANLALLRLLAICTKGGYPMINKHLATIFAIDVRMKKNLNSASKKFKTQHVLYKKNPILTSCKPFDNKTSNEKLFTGNC